MSDPNHALVLDAPELPAPRVHPLAQMIVAANPDAQTLRELLTLQREWEAGEARKAFTRALVALHADLPAVIKRDATVDYQNKAGGRTHYTHATLAAVMSAVTEPLHRHGFHLGWAPRVEKGFVEVTCRLSHAEGHAETATLVAPPDASGSKSPAQAIASTITLFERYTALSLLGIATADMPEEDGSPSAIASGVVTPALNLRAAKAIRDAGKTLDDARALCGGRGPDAWTAADLDRLRAWLRPPAPTVAHGEDDAPAAPAPPSEPTPEEVAALDAAAAEREAAPLELATAGQVETLRRAVAAQAKRMNVPAARIARDVLRARHLEHTADIPRADVDAVLAEVEAWRP